MLLMTGRVQEALLKRKRILLYVVVWTLTGALEPRKRDVLPGGSAAVHAIIFCGSKKRMPRLSGIPGVMR